MKVLICSINSKYIHSSLAAWCLAAGMERYGENIEYEIFESTINEPVEEIKKKLTKKSFDLIGFCTYIWNLAYVDELCCYIKSTKNVITVLGGPEVGFNPYEHLKKEYVDYVISGEGEKSFALLASGSEPSTIKGVSYKSKGKIMISEPFVDESDPPSPYISDYFDALNGRISYIETSRGCPFKCSFCLSGRCGNVRFFDLEESKNRILLLANSGTKTIKFVDRTFNANPKRAQNIFKFIIDNYGVKFPDNICFHFEIDASLIDDETINVLKSAPIGAIQLEIGIQSFNEKTLISINRIRNQNKLIDNIKKLISLKNMHIHIDLIAGLPYETFESFKEGFNCAYALKANMLQFGFLKILHGSDLENSEEVKCLIYDNIPPYQVKETEWLSLQEMEKLHTCEGVFDKIYNSGRFTRTCDYIVRQLGNPFEIFMNFAQFLSENSNMTYKTLDELTKSMFEYFSDFKEINKNKLRDEIVKDRLSTNKNGEVPEFLKIHSPYTKKILLNLEKNEKTRKPSGVKRAISLLKTEKKAIYVDYINQNPVTKQFMLCEVDINDI